jgi:hypothetical protein
LVERIGMVMQRSQYDDRLRRLRPDAPDRSSDLESEQLASDRPSIGRRILHTVARFCPGHSRSCATNPRNLRRSPWLCSKRQPFWELKDQVSNINDQRIVKRRAP